MSDDPLFQTPNGQMPLSEAQRALEREQHLPMTGWQQEVSRGLEFGLEAADSIRDRSIPTFSRGELPHYAGINAFLKAPYLEDVRRVGEYDVAIVGVPHDSGTTYRPGTRFGPQGIRRISALYTPYNFELGIDLREQITLCDVGDVFTIPANNEKSFDQISKGVAHVFSSGAFPIILGGDHSIEPVPRHSPAERLRQRPAVMLPPTTFWRIADDIPRRLALLLVVLSILVPLVAWWLVAASGAVDALFLPTPAGVVAALQRLWADGTLPQDIAFSLFRVLGGFLLAAVISIPLGTLMGTFASLRSLLEPIIGIVRYMPAPAFIPLLILYFGLGETPKILLIFIGTLFFNTLMIMDAVKFVPKDLIETTYTLGGRRPQVLFQVIFPYILPNIIDACRVNMAASWNLVIVAELVAATEGLGKRISLAQRFLRTNEIFAGLIVIGLIGLAIDLLFRLLLRLACRWAR